jgi:hypothetical protein
MPIFACYTQCKLFATATPYTVFNSTSRCQMWRSVFSLLSRFIVFFFKKSSSTSFSSQVSSRREVGAIPDAVTLPLCQYAPASVHRRVYLKIHRHERHTRCEVAHVSKHFLQFCYRYLTPVSFAATSYIAHRTGYVAR